MMTRITASERECVVRYLLAPPSFTAVDAASHVPNASGAPACAHIAQHAILLIRNMITANNRERAASLYVSRRICHVSGVGVSLPFYVRCSDT